MAKPTPDRIMVLITDSLGNVVDSFEANGYDTVKPMARAVLMDNLCTGIAIARMRNQRRNEETK